MKLDKFKCTPQSAVRETDDPACPGTHRILLPASPDWLSPIVSIVAAQIFTYHLALAKGLDPDLPRGLKKVTKTT